MIVLGPAAAISALKVIFTPSHTVTASLCKARGPVRSSEAHQRAEDLSSILRGAQVSFSRTSHSRPEQPCLRAFVTPFLQRGCA